jgi:hypothetical protein
MQAALASLVGIGTEQVSALYYAANGSDVKQNKERSRVKASRRFMMVGFKVKNGECFLNCVTQRRYARNVLIINALRS